MSHAQGTWLHRILLPLPHSTPSFFNLRTGEFTAIRTMVDSLAVLLNKAPSHHLSEDQVLLCIDTEVSSLLQGYEQAVDSHNGLVNGGYLSWHHDNWVHSPVPISNAMQIPAAKIDCSGQRLEKCTNCKRGVTSK